MPKYVCHSMSLLMKDIKDAGCPQEKAVIISGLSLRQLCRYFSSEAKKLMPIEYFCEFVKAGIAKPATIEAYKKDLEAPLIQAKKRPLKQAV